jgi:CRISPR-associated exonuclease Cas4
MGIVMVSALEHWSYCPRQCGLIHLESVWDENVFTMRGRTVHERADEPISRNERGLRVERALPIWSERYGLQGRADVVEFAEDGRPIPVEYKSGKKRDDAHSAIQLCAQALCLEEMFERDVPEGAVFFAASQKRQTVKIDEALRQKTLATVEAVRSMLINEELPPAVFDRRCRNCSLVDACLPQTLTKAAAARETSLFSPMPEGELP